MNLTLEEATLCYWTRSIAENLAINEKGAKEIMIDAWAMNEDQKQNLIDLFNEIRSLYLDLEED